ncbi:MAG: DUF262 domain-containing protein [Flavobacteriaceae bacterium]|nr:DUF262 domain-containing protein [Flavobacteriaceae bacterium]
MAELQQKSVEDLRNLQFYIPSYQRAYRWTETQIEELLKDIHQFDDSSDEWYCLQAVVVQKKGDKYELIDGQQRLTSIYILLQYLGETKPYTLEYDTRENTNTYLNAISEDDSKKNLDYYHIYQAKQTMENWIEENLKSEDQKEKFKQKLRNKVKVIWYQLEAQKEDSKKDAIDIFTRINMGKIPLTNAELIKALFLNSSNFSQASKEEIHLRQLEIASEWDRITYGLGKDSMWSFISDPANKMATPIDLLFEQLVAMEGSENKNNDPYHTFRVYAEKFVEVNTSEKLDAIWQPIKKFYQTIEDWYNDRELYHKIGYLLTIKKTSLKELYEEAKDKPKSKFKEHLNKCIEEITKNWNIYDMQYGDKDIRSALLLHNIQTILETKNSSSRFSFFRYKNERWDIEHIHAIADETLINDQKEWLEHNKPDTIKDEDVNKIIEKVEKDEEVTENAFKKVVTAILGDRDDSLANLCLLDRGTNRSYKNDSFMRKRKKIIQKEKEGTFIPICTRNVFMKYYSEEVMDLQIWNNNDRTNYIKDIKTKLEIQND